MGAREIRSLTWERAIRPGEELAFRVEVLDKEPDEYNPTHGFVEYELSVHVDGEKVISISSEQMIGMQEVGAEEGGVMPTLEPSRGAGTT